MTVIAATTMTAAAVATEEAGMAASETEECSGGGGHREVRRSPENRIGDFIRFHPPARRHVFDTVLKQGRPSAPCDGGNVANKKKLKPLQQGGKA